MRRNPRGQQWRGVTLLATCCLPAAIATAATLTVNTNIDAPASDGKCGLREALQAINSQAASSDCPAVGSYGNNDTIVLPAATTFQTSTLLDALRSVTIVGAGSSSTFIDSGAAHAIGVSGTTTPGRNPVLGLKSLTLRKLAAQSQPFIAVLVNSRCHFLSWNRPSGFSNRGFSVVTLGQQR